MIGIRLQKMGAFGLGVLLVALVLLGCAAVSLAQEPPAWLPATPTVASPSNAQAALDAAASRAPAATRQFKTALNDAATAAFREGKITRWQLARLRLAITFRPDAMAEAQACVVDQAVQDGVLPAADTALKDGFDWQRLLEFIKQLLPLILQIISIFQ